jgi:MFS family permease
MPGGLRELLRPPPHRGPLIAAGAVALAVGLALEWARVGDTVPDGAQAAILVAAGALFYWLGAQAPNEDGVPPAYQSVLLVTGVLVLYAGLLTLASALGARFDGPTGGALMWTSAFAGALALWPAFARNSAISLLLAALLGAIALVSLWDWVFETSSPTPYRWLLLLYVAALVLCALALRVPARRHSEVLINAAAIVLAASVLLSANPFGDEPSELPWLWELILLGSGLGLVAFGALDRSPGPAYLGVLHLVLFILLVGESEERTLLGWPLVLLAAGALMLGAGLRPRRPLPPEPPPYRAGEAPLAARSVDEGETVIRVRGDDPPT